MSAIFSVLLIAEPREEFFNNESAYHRGMLIDDFPTTSEETKATHPELLCDPQIIIADNINDALEKAMFLVERQFPEDRGWTNHDVEISDISEELELYLNNMLPNGHPFGFYLVGGVGLARDTSSNIKQYCVVGASSGIDEEHAYRRFKDGVLMTQFPRNTAWIGGLTRVTLVPEEHLLMWKTTWMYGYMLQKFQPRQDAHPH